MKKGIYLTLFAGLVFFSLAGLSAEAKVIFDFEKDQDGWLIPDWATGQGEYVTESIEAVPDVSNSGKQSLKMMCNFPGGTWKGCLCEVMSREDWTAFKTVSCDIYLPENAPTGIYAKIILSVGEKWTWTEMARSVKLLPGKWVTLSANVLPGSTDWKTSAKITDAFRQDVRKVAVRIEYDKKPLYRGPVYIDNIRVE